MQHTYINSLCIRIQPLCAHPNITQHHPVYTRRRVILCLDTQPSGSTQCKFTLEPREKKATWQARKTKAKLTKQTRDEVYTRELHPDSNSSSEHSDTAQLGNNIH